MKFPKREWKYSLDGPGSLSISLTNLSVPVSVDLQHIRPRSHSRDYMILTFLIGFHLNSVAGVERILGHSTLQDRDQ